jgi:hypothetical protein
MKLLLTTVLTAGLLLMAVPAQALPRDAQCRYQQLERASWTHTEVVKTTRCAADFFGNRNDIRYVLSIGNCESTLTAEKVRHSTSYHGVFQYHKSTFHSQLRDMGAVRRNWDLSRRVHNPRSNIVLASAWIIRRTASPWACA